MSGGLRPPAPLCVWARGTLCQCGMAAPAPGPPNPAATAGPFPAHRQPLPLAGTRGSRLPPGRRRPGPALTFVATRFASATRARDAAGAARESAGRPWMTPDTWQGLPARAGSPSLPGLRARRRAWSLDFTHSFANTYRTRKRRRVRRRELLPPCQLAAPAQRGRGPNDLKPANLRPKIRAPSTKPQA